MRCAADWPVRSVFRTVSLPQGGAQVLGANLKCSESKRAGPLLCCYRGMGSGDLAHTGPSRSRQRPFSSAEATGRHPRRFRSSWSPVTAARTRLTAILPPEVAEAGRRKFGIANRVLDVLVPEPSLQRPGIVACIRQGIAAAVPQHVGKNGEGHTGAPAEALEQRAEALG
jgi:hypothetical protein